MKMKTVKIGGAVVAASMAAAAAAYLFAGKNAPERRKKAAAWMRAAEQEIVKEAKKLKDVAFTDENYKRIVKAVAQKYRLAKDIDSKDMAEFVTAMAKKWESAGRSAKMKTSAKRKKASA